MPGKQPGPRAVAALVLLPLSSLALHLVFASGYGYFRDELYYLACADHLAWGYVDHPPVCVAALWLVRQWLGDSLWAIRMVPAVASAATVLLAGLIARDLGGGRFAQTLAMVSTLVSPELLAISSVYSMNGLDVAIWTASAWLLVRALREELAALLFLPYVAWEVGHAWPTLEFMRNATAEKMAPVSPWAFAAAQALNQHPLNLPVWLAGLAFLLWLREGRPFRPLGVLYVAVFLLLVVGGKSRSGYLAPAYPMLFAAGGAALARFFETHQWRFAPGISVVMLLIGGAITAPLAMAILPVDSYRAYAAALGRKPSTEESTEVVALPQFLADMQGWERWVDPVASAYDALPRTDQQRVGIFASNYGEAGAIDLFGAPLGLPRAISGDNNYWHGVRAGIPVRSDDHAGSRRRPAPARGGFRKRRAGGHDRVRKLHALREPPSRVLVPRARRPIGALWPGLKHYD
jgi:Dolichyl-phosphate-mannose-protein mannosyltransferase